MELLNSKRKLKNVNLTKDFHIKYYGWWFIISLCLIGVLAASFYLLYEEHWRSILFQDPYRSFEYALDRSRFVSKLVFGASVLAVFITALGIMTAHRVAGPFLKLKNAFKEIQDGNLDYRIKFRTEDELTDLESAFNKMMDSLQNKND